MTFVDTGMNIYLDKSKIIVFRNGGPLRTYETWIFRGNRVEVVTYYKYIGAFFTSTLSWNKAKETLSQQASKAVEFSHSIKLPMNLINC